MPRGNAWEIIQSEQDITNLLLNDAWHMDVLRAAAELDLPEWWIGAGFLRSFIWDVLEGNEARPSTDVDLVYFNTEIADSNTDWAYDAEMNKRYPFAKWEVRNQARMHYVDGFEPFASTEDGISHWVETATCVAVKLEQDKLKYLFCYGTDDLFGLIARPIPSFQTPELIDTFHRRVETKRWQERWPHLQVVES